LRWLGALSVLDQPAPVLEPAVIEAFCGRAGFLDWFSFAAGLVVGILLFAFVEAVVTLRWILVPSFQHWTGEELPSKPKGSLYKIL
jgi:hypothetical protein